MKKCATFKKLLEIIALVCECQCEGHSLSQHSQYPWKLVVYGASMNDIEIGSLRCLVQ